MVFAPAILRKPSSEVAAGITTADLGKPDGTGASGPFDANTDTLVPDRLSRYPHKQSALGVPINGSAPREFRKMDGRLTGLSLRC